MDLVQMRQHPGLNQSALTAPHLENQSRTQVLTVTLIQITLTLCLILLRMMGKAIQRHFIWIQIQNRPW